MSTPTISRLKGTGYNQIQIPNKSPEQMDIFRQLMGGSSGNISSILDQLKGLSGGGDEAYWDQLEAPAKRQFGQLQSDIANRFSGAGGSSSTGARRSSGFQNAQSGAATDFAERLQSQRLGLQGQARNQLMSLYSNLLGQDTYDNFLMEEEKKKKKNSWSSALSGAGSGAKTGSIFGPIGAGIGAGIGGLVGFFGGR